MIGWTRLFGALSCAFGAALLSLAAPAPARAAGVQSTLVISNTAQIEWDAGRQHLRQASNQVDISVEARNFALTAFHFGTGAGSQALTAAAPLCAGSTGSVPIALGSGWTGEKLSPASVVATTQVRAGEPLFFLLDYPAANTDPTRVESVTGIILSKSGDRETLTITETGPDTGKFAGYIQTVPGASPVGDCRLGVVSGDLVVVESIKTGNQSPFVSVEIG